MKGTTKTGFEWEMEAERLDNWDVLEQLSEMSDGNLLVAPSFLNTILGPEGKKRLIEHCREEDGRAPTQKVLDEIFDIFNQVKDGKN